MYYIESITSKASIVAHELAQSTSKEYEIALTDRE